MKFTGERYIPCKETDHKPIEQEHWQRYMAAQQLVDSDMTVLDIASGEGYGSNYLAEKALKVFGIDISGETIAYAKNAYQKRNIEFINASMTDIPLPDNSVDLVVSFETIEHVGEEDQSLFLEEVRRILRESGHMILSCPNEPIASGLAYKLWGYRNEFHKKEYDEQNFKKLLNKFFPWVQMLYQRNEQALILNAPDAKSLAIQWGEKKHYDYTQNLIAVCGREAIDLSKLNCIMLDSNEFYQQSQRVLSDYVNALQDVNSEKSKLSERLASADEEKSKLLKKLETTQNDNSRLLRELTAAKQQAEYNENRLHKANQDYRRNEAKTRRCLQEQKQEINAIKSELNCIRQSTIWRFSAPLRYILDSIKSIRNHH